MLIRLSKILLLAASGFFLTLVVFNNLTDVQSNWQFVKHVLAMDALKWEAATEWRAIDSPIIHGLFFASIILWEAIAGVLCWWGAWRLWKTRSADAATFNRAKEIGVAGLVLSMLQWYVAFISVGGEWFYMWASEWNGQDAAWRMFGIMGISLIFLCMQDDDPAPVRAA
ncbi:MAG: DUF2165 family protein [Opitutales bacterium]